MPEYNQKALEVRTPSVQNGFDQHRPDRRDVTAEWARIGRLSGDTGEAPDRTSPRAASRPLMYAQMIITAAQQPGPETYGFVTDSVGQYLERRYCKNAIRSQDTGPIGILLSLAAAFAQTPSQNESSRFEVAAIKLSKECGGHPYGKPPAPRHRKVRCLRCFGGLN